MPAQPDLRSDRNGSGYPKSERTRAGILAAAIAVFADHGFTAASTRAIAQAAGVALPAIAYHFGSKQGLYVACVEVIVQGHQAALAAPVADAERLLTDPDIDADAARAMTARLLKAALRSFVDPCDGQARVDFAVRALRGPDTGLAMLRDQVWTPGVMLCSRLVAVARNSSWTVADRADALALISGILAYPLGGTVAAGLLGLADDPPGALNVIEAAIDRQVAAIRPLNDG